jgi:outer membrane protein OmpU
VKSVLWASVYAAVVACASAVPAYADLLDWQVSPFTTDVGDAVLTVGGSFDGTGYLADQPGFPGLDQSGVTGAASVSAKLERTYDTGLVLSLRSVFEVFHDKLSGDNYGSDLVQKVYGVAQTGLGRVEIGMTDGAAYSLAVTGPTVDGVTSLDNPNATFFIDPTTGRAFINVFTGNTAVEPTLNYAKLSYYSPRLFGVQIGLSFTPSEGKDVLPFITAGPTVFNRQKNIWEAAASYQGESGRLSYGLSASIAVGHAANKTPGHQGLTDWAVGAQADYDLSDDMKFSLGGAYRDTNQYTFNLNNVLKVGGTRAVHLSTTLTKGSWIVGGEYENGSADGSIGLPDLGLHDWEASIGYVLNSNMQLTAGWQQLNYSRNAGLFYNGSNRISMDAEFLHLNFHI